MDEAIGNITEAMKDAGYGVFTQCLKIDLIVHIQTVPSLCICCGSILSLVQFSFSFVFVYDNELKTKENKN